MHLSFYRLRATRLFVVLLMSLAPQVRNVSAQQTSQPSINKNPAAAASTQAAPSAEADQEDWGSLSLEHSHLQAGKPFLVEKDSYPEFTRDLLRLEWRAGDPIELYVVRPVGTKNPPVILYLYSYPYENPRFLDEDFCRRVTKAGFAAVGFMSAMTGHRYHGRPMKQWFVSELREALGSSVHDVQLILNYLGTRGDLDMNRVGMFGDGSGATIAILAAAADARIETLDLYNPWGDWSNWMAKSLLVPEAERAAYLKPDFLSQVASLDPVHWLPKLKARRVRIQDVTDDAYTPEVCKKHIEAAAPTWVKINRYQDAEALRNASAKGRLFEWIKANVGSVTLQANKAGGGN